MAANHAESHFISHAISIVYLLNQENTPFYKWMHRGLLRLPISGNTLFHTLDTLVTASESEFGENVYNRKIQLIELVCQHIAQSLRSTELSDSGSDFLLDHGPFFQDKIQDPQIKSMNVWTG